MSVLPQMPAWVDTGYTLPPPRGTRKQKAPTETEGDGGWGAGRGGWGDQRGSSLGEGQLYLNYRTALLERRRNKASTTWRKQSLVCGTPPPLPNGGMEEGVSAVYLRLMWAMLLLTLGDATRAGGCLSCSRHVHLGMWPCCAWCCACCCNQQPSLAMDTTATKRKKKVWR